MTEEYSWSETSWDGRVHTHTTEENILTNTFEWRWIGSTETETSTAGDTETSNELKNWPSSWSGNSVTVTHTLPYPDGDQARDHWFYIDSDPGSEDSEYVEYEWAVYDGSTELDSGSGSRDVLGNPTASGVRVVNTGYVGDDLEFTITGVYDENDNEVTGAGSIGGWAVTRSEDVYEYEPSDFSLTVNGSSGSASYSNSLGDGETSPWLGVSGVVEGDNEFETSLSSGYQYTHNIDIEYRYEYEVDTEPDPIKHKVIHVNGTTYDLPLVDPNDDNLEYDNFRYCVNGDVLAADLVNTSHEDASPYRVYVPTEGTLAWREDVN